MRVEPITVTLTPHVETKKGRFPARVTGDTQEMASRVLVSVQLSDGDLEHVACIFLCGTVYSVELKQNSRGRRWRRLQRLKNNKTNNYTRRKAYVNI